MRKVLSVTLVVVMLAALVTVFPVSAATASVPALLITEVCQDTTGWSGNGSDTGDTYEFIELYNASTSAVNLYDYAMVITVKNDSNVGKDPKDVKFDRVDPIVQKGTSEFNTAGTISTANYAENPYNLYPVNPETATVAPGKTAVIWFYGGDAMKSAAAKGSAVTIEEFREYFHMSDDIIVVAVDANGGAKDATATGIYSATAKLEDTFNVAGVPDAASDAFGYSKRFNLYNSEYRLYGITTQKALNDQLRASKALTDLKLSSCISYAGCDQTSKDAKKSLSYKSSEAVTGSGSAGTIANVSTNFIVTNKKVSLCFDGTAKDKEKIKYMGLDRMNFATPGLLLPSQVTNLTKAKAADYDLTATSFTEPYTVVNGLTTGTSSVKGYYIKDTNNLYVLTTDDVAAVGVTYYANDVAYIRNVKTTTSYTKRVSYTAYLENFFGMADSSDSEAILKALGWNRSIYLNNGGTAKLSIVNGQLVVDNLDVDANGNAVLTDAGDIDSADSIFTICPASIMSYIALDDFTLEYELTYLDAQENLRYAMVVTNFDGKCSYDTMHIRVNGAGNGQTRSSGTYVNYENKKAVNYAANSDADPVLTSIVNKITNGAEKVKTTESTDMSKFTTAQKAEYAPLVGRTIKVKVEVNQLAGQKLYVNDILVSETATDSNGVALSPYWGIKTNTDELALGLFVSQRLKVAIDNIKVSGYTEDNTTEPKVKEIPNKNLVEPATGDATIYVAVAMAVSFISLATLVVVKRRKNEN